MKQRPSQDQAAELGWYDFDFDPTDKAKSYYWLLQFTRQAQSVLEIGCATGFFSRHLVAQGSRVTGVELNPQAAAKANTICRRVITGDIERPETQTQIADRFDAVVLGDVLEHLKSPELLLIHIRQQWLKPDGCVVISVPNSGHWIFRREILCGRFPYRQYGLFDRTHLRFFTWDSLQEMISQAGYIITDKAFTINPNFGDDITFAWFAPVYRRRLDLLRAMIKLEKWLAVLFPKLFGYQFVFKLQAAN